MSSTNLPRTPLQWLKVFGPGAIIASLTIGAGELIFSSRAGAIFGYRLLWFFLLILLFKWSLVLATARHMVLTGAHPFQRWLDFPGPRGWLPLLLFLLALVCFPVWVAFHAGTTGTLIGWLTGTQGLWNGSGPYLWGILLLGAMLLLAFTGGYTRLEKVQLGVTILMLVAVLASVFFLKPDWLEVLTGTVIPQSVTYPEWLLGNPDFLNRPVWVETVTYVGIIGGSGYDYLAYISYLREKRWGQAGNSIASPAELEAIARDRNHPNRRWIRGVLVDCTLSFAAVLVFAGVFVICGAIILQPQQKLPSGADLLTLQADFVTPVYPWLRFLYFVGAFLAMTGTLYGTIEVAPTIFREMWFALTGQFGERNALSEGKPALKDRSSRIPLSTWTVIQIRRWSLLWVCVGGAIVLIGSVLYRVFGLGAQPSGLIALVTPANLFTGVLACGIISASALWMDQRFLPAALRMNWSLKLLNLIGAFAFVALGLKGYWDYRGWAALGLLGATLALGWILALWLGRRMPKT